MAKYAHHFANVDEVMKLTTSIMACWYVVDLSSLFVFQRILSQTESRSFNLLHDVGNAHTCCGGSYPP